MVHPFKPADADEMARRGLNPDGTPIKQKPVKQVKPVKASTADTSEAPDGTKN